MTEPARDAAPGDDAGGFDNPVAHDAAQPELMLLDGGGAARLPDGAIVYLALSARPCPDDNMLSYESFGQGFFDGYCQRCHGMASPDRSGAPPGVTFDSLDSIREIAGEIWSVAADSNRLMPESGTAPSPAERIALGEWLACGAPTDAVL
jgi:mono/diheme cytochrome c family protein